MCENRWRVESVNGTIFNVTVTWDPPSQARGVRTGYILSLTDFAGSTVTNNVMVDATSTSYTFMETFSELAGQVCCSYWHHVSVVAEEGVPYNVSIVAVNRAGVSREPCVIIDFSRQSSEYCL